MTKKKAVLISIFTFSLIFLSTVFCAVHTSAQYLNITRDQDWDPNGEQFDVPVTNAGGELVFTCLFHTSDNCKLYGEVVNETNDFLDSSKFVNHFYLYQGDFLVKDMGLPSEDPVTHIIKTNETEIAGTIKYTMMVVVTIASGVGNTTGENYKGKFRIVAYLPPEETGESGAGIVVALGLPVNATIILDITPPEIDEIYTFSGETKILLSNATITEWFPTLRAEYHDPMPGSGVDANSVWIQLDGQKFRPTKWDDAKLYYNAPTLLEGAHSFTVNVSDKGANTNETTVFFNITRITDTTAPTITYVSPAENETLNITQPTFIVQWHDNENGSGINLNDFQFAVDGSTYSVPLKDVSDTGFIYTIATKLRNGPHWWSVQIKDYERNSASRLINFTVEAADEFPPSSALNIVGVDGWNIILGWTAADNPDGVGVANVTIYYAINSYRDAYGAYAWTRWQIFSNDTTNAMFDAKAVRLKKGDTIYFRSTAEDWNGNKESKWDPDASVVFTPPEEEAGLNWSVIAGLFLIGVVGIGAIIIIWFVGTEKKAKRAVRKAKEVFEDAKKAGAEEFFPDKVKEFQKRIDAMERAYKRAEYEKVILMAGEIEKDALALKSETLKMVEEKKRAEQNYTAAEEAVDKAKSAEGEKYVPELMIEIDTLVKEYEALFGKHEFVKAQEIAKGIKEKAEQAEREAIEKKKEEEEKPEEEKEEEEVEAEELEEEIKRLEELKKKLEQKKKKG